MMASSYSTDLEPSTTLPYHSSKKPAVLPPTSVSSVSHQRDQLSKFKPPPVPVKQTKSANYYHHVSGKLGPASSASIASCSAVGFKPSTLTAITAGGSDDRNQDPDKLTSEVYSLAEFISLYKHSLPLRIRVKVGFCGKEERAVISAGDVYNFHFIKNETVLSIEDEGGKSFSIPLNSSIKFGILHDSQSSDKSASLGPVTYKTIGHLVSCCIPPFIVRTLQNYNSSETESSVEAEEVLIIKEVIRRPYHNLYVKAFSLHTHKQKVLFEDCGGCFLADPSCVQLYASEIVEHLKDSLPLKATLFLDSIESDCPLPRLASEVVTLKHTDVESSIIATTCWDENDAIPDVDTDDDNIVPVAIPTDLKISITLLANQSENESLYEDTRKLYETFDPSKIYTMSSSESNVSGDYAALKSTVRSEHEYPALDIIKPNKVYGEVQGSCSSLPKLPMSHSSGHNKAKLIRTLKN